MKKLKLFTQIIIIALICILLVPTILSAFVIPIFQDVLSNTIFDMLEFQLDNIAEDNNAYLNSYIYIDPNGNIEIEYLTIADKMVDRFFIDQLIENSMSDEKGVGFLETKHNNLILYAYEKTQDNWTRIVFTTTFISKAFIGNENIRAIWLSSLYMIFPIIILTIWLIYISQSIKSIEKSITNDNEKRIIASKELQSLSNTLDVYKTEINQATEQKIRLFQNISHELKTPITTIKMYAEGIEDGVYMENDIKNNTAIIKEEADVLLDRVNKIMDINKLYHIEENEKDIPNQKVVLGGVIFDLLDTYNKRAPNIKFNAKLDKNEWRGNREVWENIFSNIFDNNIKHGAKNIRIKMDPNSISIDNDGDKIDEEVLKRIFEPFIKGENGNYGLGLNIIQESLKLLGYTVEIKNTVDGVNYSIKA